MNVGTLIGFLASLAVFVGTVATSLKNPSVVFDAHAGLIVIGGTMTVSLICFPLNRLYALLGVFGRRLLGKHKRNYAALIAEVVVLSNAHRKGAKSFENAIPSIKDPFLREAAGVLLGAGRGQSRGAPRPPIPTATSNHGPRFRAESGENGPQVVSIVPIVQQKYAYEGLFDARSTLAKDLIKHCNYLLTSNLRMFSKNCQQPTGTNVYTNTTVLYILNLLGPKPSL